MHACRGRGGGVWAGVCWDVGWGCVAESELGVGWGVGRGCAGGVLVVWAGEAEALSVAAF